MGCNSTAHNGDSAKKCVFGYFSLLARNLVGALLQLLACLYFNVYEQTANEFAAVFNQQEIPSSVSALHILPDCQPLMPIFFPVGTNCPSYPPVMQMHRANV